VTTTRVGPEALGAVATAMKGVIVTRYDARLEAGSAAGRPVMSLSLVALKAGRFGW
jgi:hypothetical protein